jgi:hypothetical protein
MKGTTVYISNPTWGNHRNIFGDEGVEWKYYRCGFDTGRGGDVCVGVCGVEVLQMWHRECNCLLAQGAQIVVSSVC